MEQIFFSFKFKDIEKINSLSYVEKIIIQRDLPNALRIKVIERDAVAKIVVDRKIKFIDKNGYIFSINTSLNQISQIYMDLIKTIRWKIN